jgi:predicted transcriptional regulator
MSHNLIVINPDDTIMEAARLMKERRIKRIPVVKDSRLVGMVTTSDLVKLCSAGGESPAKQNVNRSLLVFCIWLAHYHCMRMQYDVAGRMFIRLLQLYNYSSSRHG